MTDLDRPFKEIPLTQGMVALVSNEDYEYLSQFKWHVAKHHGNCYAMRNIGLPDGRKSTTTMHQDILGTGIDHIDGNGLNNQRHNLRLCTTQQNQFNRRSQRNSSSRHKGVSLQKRTGKWMAQIWFNGIKKHLGYFCLEEDAARAYDAAALKYFGEFARPNFSE